jgi:hypothetical protein
MDTESAPKRGHGEAISPQLALGMLSRPRFYYAARHIRLLMADWDQAGKAEDIENRLTEMMYERSSEERKRQRKLSALGNTVGDETGARRAALGRPTQHRIGYWRGIPATHCTGGDEQQGRRTRERQRQPLTLERR